MIPFIVATKYNEQKFLKSWIRCTRNETSYIIGGLLVSKITTSQLKRLAKLIKMVKLSSSFPLVFVHHYYTNTSYPSKLQSRLNTM